MFELLFVIVNSIGIQTTVFSPGDGIYLLVDRAGEYVVSIYDESIGVLIHTVVLTADAPGRYLIWQTSPNTAEGRYRVVVRSGDAFDVYQIYLVKSPPWWIWNVAIVVAAAAAAAVYVVAKRGGLKLGLQPPRGYILELPSGLAVSIDDEKTIFGREFFLKLGVSKEIAQYISRAHFTIFRSRGRYYIEDLDSKNGTFLNGRLIKGLKPQSLRDGDIITVGNVLTLKFRERR
ncbi:MAG: FHA domain-containing protein [Pyrobaculum sp.]